MTRISVRPTPRQRRTRRVLVGSLAGGLAGGLLGGLAGAAHHSAPAHAAAAANRPQVARVADQAASAPTPVHRARASRGAPRTALPTTTVAREVATGPAFTGEASWYGGSFQGQRTANGETFDTTELTAASKTLPFGTRLRVCRSSSCVVVRVNDRGPYVGGRVLDLSRAAASRLGYSGVAEVTATPVAVRRLTVVDQQALARQRFLARRAQAAQRIAAALRGTPAVAQATAVAAPASPSSPSAPVPSGAAAGTLLAGAVALRRTRLAA